MAVQLEHPADEIKRLQRCINDLVSVLALPAIWSGGEPSQIVGALINTLMGMLRLDLAYVRLNGPSGEAPIEMVRVVESRTMTGQAQEITSMLKQFLGEDPQTWPPMLRKRVGDDEISIVPMQLGLQGELGVFVVGSRRPDFPEQAEKLVLSVAANQAVIGLQEARRLSEQKRLSKELDQRVAQRTEELSAANEELKKEVAERRRVEEASRLRELKFGLVVDSVPVPVAVTRPSGEVEGVNRPTLEYFGTTLEELKGWKSSDAVHPDDLQRTIAAQQEAHESGCTYNVECRQRRADGSYRWFNVRGFPLRDTEGRILRRFHLLIDIDDRKRAEQELRRSEAFLAYAQRVSSTGSFSWRVDTDEITFSEEASRIFEFEPDVPLTLERIAPRIHPEDIALLSQKIADARDTASDQDYELRLKMPDDRVKYVHTISHATRDGNGRLEFIGAIQDVTERRLSEEALGKLRTELAHVTRVTSLGAMTASIAHEVNQPLSGIVTNASTCLRMLAADPPNIEGARETARRTIRDGNRASDVITRLRALFSKKDVTTELVDLNEATREVIELTLRELQRNRVVLRQELAQVLPQVTGDRVQLQQVILNLLRNASDAMAGIVDRPRQLVIRTEQDGSDHVRLTVEDTGVGFGPQGIDRLFEAFYTTKNDGMGIGLSVSRSIIESHHGQLRAGLNDGPGATFSFSIPCENEDSTGSSRTDAA